MLLNSKSLFLRLLIVAVFMLSTACTLTASIIDLSQKKNTNAGGGSGGSTTDVLGPVGTIDFPSGATSVAPLSFTVTFNEPIENPAVSDFQITNGSIINVSGSGQVFTILVNPIGFGSVVLSLNAASFFDLHANTNTVIDTQSVTFQAPGDPLTLLKKINSSEKGSYPSDYLKLGSKTFFSAGNSQFGRELWVTDGTEAGTQMVKDINPGVGSSDPHGLIAYAGKVFFGAKTDGLKIDLWVSDGTLLGTHRVKDFGLDEPYINATYPMHIANGILFFNLNLSSGGWKLARTDGSAAGTYELRSDIDWVGIHGVIGNRLLFRGQTSALGTELYYSEGTEATTALLLDINPGPNSGYFGSGGATSNAMLFLADDGVSGWKTWRTDGTAIGTVFYDNANFSPWVSGDLFLFNYGGNAYVSDGISPKRSLGANPLYSFKYGIGASRHFYIAAGAGGAHLFSTDGVSAINHGDVDLVGNSSGDHKEFITTNIGAFFPYNTGADGWELRFHDGTLASQVALGDQNPGVGSLITDEDLRGIAFGDSLIFRGFTPATGTELWISDGTAGGTKILKDIFPGVGSSYPISFYNEGSFVYFAATDGVSGFELWRTDGTPAGTSQVINIERSPEGSNIKEITIVGSNAFFVAQNPENGSELWKTDGTAAGTVLVKDIYPNSEGSFPHDLVSLAGNLIFIAAGSGYENLYKSDGTSLGTSEIKPSFLASSNDYIAGLVRLGSNVYFQAGDAVTAAGRELFKSDGSSGGTGLAANLSAGISSFFDYGSNDPPVFVNETMGKVIFVKELMSDFEPWSSDGTIGGSQELSADAQYAYGFFNVNSQTYFMANNAVTSEDELWVTDGTPGGTLPIDIEVGTSSNGWILGSLGSNLIFMGNTAAEGRELWVTDGTMLNTHLIKDLTSGVGDSTINDFSKESVGGKLFFTFDDGINGSELWVTDGSSSGTIMLKDINPGMDSSFPSQYFVMGGYVYFAAESPGNGRELWRSDGTPAGTIQLIDSVPGPDSLFPESLTQFGSSLLFTGLDANGDRELHLFLPPP